MSSFTVPNLDVFLPDFKTELRSFYGVVPDLATMAPFADRLRANQFYQEGIKEHENANKNAKAIREITETSTRVAQAAFDEINKMLGPRGSKRGSGVEVVPRATIWKEILQRAEEQKQPPEVIERIRDLLDRAGIAIDRTNLSTRMYYLSLANMRECFEAAHAAMEPAAKTDGEKALLEVFLRRVKTYLPSREQLRSLS